MAELRKNWLIIESLHNWSVDQANEFSYFGIAQRHRKLKDLVKAGDRLYAYVIGVSRFSDVREVTSDGIRDLPRGGDYEQALPYCIDTKPLLILPLEKWLPVSEVLDELKLTKGKRHWGNVLRAAPRVIDPSDAALLHAKMEAPRSAKQTLATKKRKGSTLLEL